MPAETNSTPSVATPGARIARRAVLGLGILAVATGGAASLLYGSIEADADFSIDPDARQRLALLAAVSEWDRHDMLDAVVARAATRSGAMQVLAGAPLLQMRRSAAQKLVEELQSASGGPRRLVLAGLTIEASEAAGGFNHARAALEALVERGVDGVFLDCAAVYAAARKRGTVMVDELAVRVSGLVSAARQVNPNFLFVIDNAAELTANLPLGRVIDGVARDDLLFGLEGSGTANKRTEVIAALHDLNRIKRSGRPVFVSERLPADAGAARSGAQQTLRTLGFVPRFAVQPAG